MSYNQPLSIAFIHPDLGIGGAEKLIINLAIALKQKGHQISIYTPFYDTNHCFQETKNLHIEVHGNLFPRTIFGKMWAFCANMRMLLCTLFLLFFRKRYDLIIVDQVTLPLIILRIFGKKSIFYCHFPDKLLCVDRKSIIKRFYRFFMDYIEEFSLLFANKILVNSLFTQEIYLNSFPKLKKRQKIPEVLYPAVDFSHLVIKDDQQIQKNPYFLSLNRFEGKKNVILAIQAFSIFLKKHENCELVIAGGYDEKIKEYKENLDFLKKEAFSLKIKKKISFKLNISDFEKIQLIKNSIGVLYTPPNEHFGIVPVECMFLEKIVLALNSGGPKESLKDEECGFLLENKIEKWADKMAWVYENQDKCKEMGKKGKQRAIQMFGFSQFANYIDNFAKDTLLKEIK